jgi:thiamine kinase-like enzyme
LTHLEERMIEKRWKLLSKEVIHGAHAGSIVRADVLDDKNQRGSYIYKQFAADRNSEIDIYEKLINLIKQFCKLVQVWNKPPQAILMHDLMSPLKDKYDSLFLTDRKKVITGILQRLSDLHSTSSNLTPELPIHQISSEWRSWCLDEMKKLCDRHHWAKYEWIQTINDVYDQLSLSNFEARSPLVLTHGDPHLENIFHYEEQIWFIDWEWAAIGSPLRDISILLQDIYDIELIHFVIKAYWKLLKEKQFNIIEEDYMKDFNYLYIDHTTMMLAWEKHKYFQGFTNENSIKKITEFKVGEIKRIAIVEKGLFN